MVIAGVVPYQAMKRAYIAPSTMYRSRFYKLWLKVLETRATNPQLADKLLTELRGELDVTRATPKMTKRDKFLASGSETT